MERIIELENLYNQIQQLLDEKNDTKMIQKQLGIVHLNILKRDLLLMSNEKDINKELEVYNKLAFYLVTKLTNYKQEIEVTLLGFETAAFCFEILFKSEFYNLDQQIEYGILSSICYSLAENQSNSIVMARFVINYLNDNKQGNMYIYGLFLARDFKKIIRNIKENTSANLIENTLFMFSKSMIYSNEHDIELLEFKETVKKIRENQIKEYYFIRLIYLVARKMNDYSIRNLLIANPELQEYMDVLTQKEINNVYELWHSQDFLFANINEIIDTDNIFMLSLPTSAGKTLISELLLFEFLSDKKGIAVYVVPSIALTNEIENSFIRRFRKVGINIVKELELDGDSNIEEPSILILTPEKLDLLTRKNEELFSKLKCIVFDEFHKVSDGQRGWLEETLIAWFIFNKDKYTYKIIMMSAIIDDLEESITDINAFVHIGKWTPTKKIYGMFYLPKEQVKVYGDNVYQNEKIEESFNLQIKYERKLQARVKNVFQRTTYGKARKNGKDTNKSDTKYDLCWKAVKALNEMPVLVYFLAKKDIKYFISRCQKYCDKVEDSRLKALQKNVARQLGNNHPLIKALDYGVAFHNGDLPEDVRAVLESAYKSKLIRILACTTTLADGVNMPVSTLVIGNIFNYDYKYSLGKGDYKNIVGRIGRALVDTEGKIFLIKYPDYYKDDIINILEKYYYGEDIENKLESAFENIEEPTLEIIEMIEYAELDKEKKDLKAMLQRIQVFVFSLYEELNQYDLTEFMKQYDNSFFLKASTNRREIMNKYVTTYYGLAKAISFDFLKKCNKTGVSYETNCRLSNMADYLQDSHEIYEVISEEIYNQLLKCDEFLPDDVNVNHYEILQSWLNGDSYLAIREKYFGEYSNLEKSTEKCTQYVRKMFQYIIPWAISALAVYADEKHKANFALVYLLRCIKYGTLELNVVRLCESGIKSRELAIDLNDVHNNDVIDSEEDVLEWVVNVPKQKLENAFGNKFDKYILEQVAKYRSTKKSISHYFEKSNAIKCLVMGLKFYDYMRLDSSDLNKNSCVVLVQDFENSYDMYAVKVMTQDLQYMIGYIPMLCSEEVFDLLESGYILNSFICQLEPNKVQIRIEKVEM